MDLHLNSRVWWRVLCGFPYAPHLFPFEEETGRLFSSRVNYKRLHRAIWLRFVGFLLT